MAATKSPFLRSAVTSIPPVAQATSSAFVAARVTDAGTVDAVTFTPAATITGAATNTRKVSLINKGQDGNGSTVVATLQFNNAINADDFVPKVIPVSGTPANLVVAAGDILAWASDSVGTGLADPGGLVLITLSRNVGRVA